VAAPKRTFGDKPLIEYGERPGSTAGKKAWRFWNWQGGEDYSQTKKGKVKL
jgi:hypothetical protein